MLLVWQKAAILERLRAPKPVLVIDLPLFNVRPDVNLVRE